MVGVGSLFCRFPSGFRQADPFVRIHGQIAALAQVLHGLADAGLGHMERPCHVQRAHRTVLLFQSQDRFEILLAGPVQFHEAGTSFILIWQHKPSKKLDISNYKYTSFLKDVNSGSFPAKTQQRSFQKGRDVLHSVVRDR